MKFEYYESGGLWYWRTRAKNGRITSDGAEGYASKRNVLRAIWRFKAAASNGLFQVHEVEE